MKAYYSLDGTGVMKVEADDRTVQALVKKLQKQGVVVEQIDAAHARKLMRYEPKDTEESA